MYSIFDFFSEVYPEPELDTGLEILESSSNSTDPNIPNPCTSSSSAIQPKISELFANIRQWDINSTKARQFHFLIGELIAVDNQPFSIVKDEGFNRLLKKAIPAYNIPSEKYFRENIVPNIYKKCKDKIKNEIMAASSKISITSDIWTSQYNNNSYISLTGHWIDNDFGARISYVLSVNHFPGSHTSQAISEILSQMMSEWSITNRIHLFIADNASNMKKGIRDLKVFYESCFIHSLQLVVENSIKSQRSVIDIIAKCKNIVGHFSHSSSACSKLKTIQQQLNLPMHKLIQSVPTRWNSTLYMLERLFQQKQAINLYIAEKPELLDLNYSQWELVKSIINILKPFEEITKICSYKSSCISEVIPFVMSLNKFLTKSHKDETHKTFFGIGTLRDELRKNLETRFVKDIFEKKNFTLSTFLDPRFKAKFFDVEVTDAVVSDIKLLIVGTNNNPELEKGGEIDLSDDDDELPLSCLAPPPTKIPKIDAHTLFWDSYEEYAGAGLSKKTSPIPNKAPRASCSMTLKNLEIDKEIKDYLALSVIPRTENCFIWWQLHNISFPNLYKLAKDYLSAPSASVYSEQVFSEAGNICNPNRSRLNPDITEFLIFLHHNLPKLNFNY